MVIDISPLISDRIAVWPGDQAFRSHFGLKIAEGSNIDLSSIEGTVHLGAHADAPSHYRLDAPSIDQVDLEPYLGPCYVIDIVNESLIKPEHGFAAIQQGYRRLLFKTNSYPDPEVFHEDFTAFSAEAVAAFGKAGVVLLGIDTPSVDPFSSKTLPAHQELWRFQIRNLEGLVLTHVVPGAYELIALPLKLKGLDASPVRAVLRPIQSSFERRM